MGAHRKVKVYISSHNLAQAAALALDVRAAGHEVVSKWHDETPVENFVETLDGFGKTKQADDNFADIDKADVLIQITGTEKVPGGKFVELGYALGRGKKVFLYNHGSTPKPENLASNGSGIGKLYTVRDHALLEALDGPRTNAVLGEVQAERAYQDKRWNSGGHSDVAHETNESFTKYIHEYADNEVVRGKKRTPRERFIKVAALAVAAVERIDQVNADAENADAEHDC